MLVIVPRGMDPEIAHKVAESEEEWQTYVCHGKCMCDPEGECTCVVDEVRVKQCQAIKAYRTTSEIASWRRGYADCVGRSRALAYKDYYGNLVDTVPLDWHTKEPVKGWDARSYVDGWERCADLGTYDESEDSWNITHFRITVTDAGNFCTYVREVSIVRFEPSVYDRLPELMKGMAFNAIDQVCVVKLAGRTMDDKVLEIKPSGRDLWVDARHR